MLFRTNKLLNVSFISMALLSLFTTNVQAGQCSPESYMVTLLLGESEHSITTQLSPFQVISDQPDIEKILWITNQVKKHGQYNIRIQGKQNNVEVIAVNCQDLTYELEITLESARQVLNQSSALNPHADFFQQMGLSFDQVDDIHRIAFDLAGKIPPISIPLTKTLNELASQIAIAEDKYTSRSLTKVAAKQYHMQTVYFGTTRSKSKKEGKYYNGKRDIEKPLHLGRANISIPYTHKKGVIEQPFLSIEWLKKDDKHLVIQSVTELKPDEFWPRLSINNTKDAWSSSMIVYVHGFNVTFDAAIKRTAQMAYDFEYPGVPMLFSWPSNGSLMGYASDREDAIWSASHFATFLENLRMHNPDTLIHIVAHSMGNQVLLNALNELSLKQGTNTTKFGNVILAAPDVDSEWFKYQLAPRITQLAEKWAIYTSENDGALMASEEVNQNKRLGMPGNLVPNIDTIDTSGLNAAPWSIPESHSYYANKLPVIEDIVMHLKGTPPSKRNLTKSLLNNEVYWKLNSE